MGCPQGQRMGLSWRHPKDSVGRSPTKVDLGLPWLAIQFWGPKMAVLLGSALHKMTPVSWAERVSLSGFSRAAQRSAAQRTAPGGLLRRCASAHNCWRFAQRAMWGDVDRSIREDRAANARNEVALVVLDRRVTLSDTALAIESERQHWERLGQGGAWRAASGDLTWGSCLCRPPGRRELWSTMEGSELMSDERNMPPEGQC